MLLLLLLREYSLLVDQPTFLLVDMLESNITTYPKAGIRGVAYRFPRLFPIFFQAIAG
jgi:hypothetical protein